MQPLTKEQVENARKQFQISGTYIGADFANGGNINDTIILEYVNSNEPHRYIMQRINTDIISSADELMKNIEGVTSFLKKKIILEGGDPMRETLTIIPTHNGYFYYKDDDGICWRVYLFIENATAYNKPESLEILYQSALAFGTFQARLEDYPVQTLYEVIPGFHDTKRRYYDFQLSLKKNLVGRKTSVLTEVEFLLNRSNYAYALAHILSDGNISIRVTHNDTKLSNVMIDNDTGKALCVIDLDTVMPGLSVTDFGDAVRFGASTASEDEKDLEKVHFDINRYNAYREGFLEGCRGTLTRSEIELLPLGAKVITYEQCLRFLTDYLNGDRYYKTERENQNIDRTRTQIRLLEEMEKQI